MADPLIFAVSPSVWKSFSAEDQALLKQAAIDAGKWEIEKSRAEEAQRLAAIRERGVQVIELSATERQAFVEATAPCMPSGRSASAPTCSRPPATPSPVTE